MLAAYITSWHCERVLSTSAWYLWQGRLLKSRLLSHHFGLVLCSVVLFSWSVVVLPVLDDLVD